ncbi:AMP-binding protein [Nonomuraea dietziae]|uniref:AMP-binding protein n=1 Tax=Nonomuraea dietziae TaxID=65515 RepID=UPI0031D9C524
MHPGAIAAVTPDKPAVIMAGSGQVVTYRELEEESNRLAHLFRSAGLKPGDHIAFMLENHPLFLVIAWAAQRSGLYYTAISSRLRSEELNYIVENCEARIFISSAGLAEVATTVSAPGVERRLMLDGVAEGFESYEKAVEGLPATPIEDECQGSDMLYSSGTTGRPKGVKPTLSQAPLDTPRAAAAAHPVPLRAVGRTASTSRPRRSTTPRAAALLPAVPAARGDGGGDGALRCRRVPRAGRAVQGDALAAGADHVHQDAQAALQDDYDLSSLKCAIHAAAPCPVPVKEQMLDWWGPIIHEYYAGTEGNGFLYAGPPPTGWPTRARSAAPFWVWCTSWTRRATSCRQASAARFTSPTARASSTTATPTRPAPRRTRGAGAGPRSATSATSTRTASST